MPNGFSFQVQGLNYLIKVFNQLPAQAQKEIGAELKVTANEIKDGAKRDAPADEARLKQSISFREVGKTEYEDFVQVFYAGYIEFGTKTKTSIPAGLEDIAGQLKGPSSGQGNPLEAIRQWVKRKQISGTYSVKTRRRTGNAQTKEKQDKQVAFLIWRHIKKFGIKPHPYFFKQIPIAEPKLKRRIANVIKSLIE